MKNYILSILLCLICSSALSGQNTVGLIKYDPGRSFLGYNLIYPHNQSSVFLLDNCGQIVQQWEGDTDSRPGNSAYLRPNGDLIKTKRPISFIGDAIWAGGGGATVESVTWDNSLNWSFTQNDSTARLHHDIAPMENGNVLMVSWERKTLAAALQNGRNPATLDRDELWPDYVLEYNPVLDSIVWEWHAWDHLIQDFDDSKDNFGVISEHPELIDINWDTRNGNPDWMHVNAIDYNEYLDQIVISVPAFNEIWVIDHSTTTAEAAGHTGGSFGKGGDLLYRWGNAAAYTGDTSQTQQLFFSHDIHWMNPQAGPDDADFGKMAVFNNRLPNNTSTANVFQTPVDIENNEYLFDPELTYGPASFSRTIIHPESPIRASSNSVSSAQILPNGNALVCSGRWGFNYEVTPENELVWEYILPLQQGSPVTQGTELFINDNFLFRMKRYAEDYGAFNNRNLEPQEYLELNPNPAFCDELLPIAEVSVPSKINIHPTLVRDYIELSSDQDFTDIEIVSSLGTIVKRIKNVANGQQINLSDLNSGVYFVVFSKNKTSVKMVKL